MSKRPGLFDLNLPFFNPLWRRVVTVAVVLGWTLVELATGSFAWAIIFGAAGLWAAYQFFVVWTPIEPDEPAKSDD